MDLNVADNFCEEHSMCKKSIGTLEEEMKEMKRELGSIWKRVDGHQERIIRLEMTTENIEKNLVIITDTVKEIKKGVEALKTDLLTKIENVKNTKQDKWIGLIGNILKLLGWTIAGILTYTQFFQK